MEKFFKPKNPIKKSQILSKVKSPCIREREFRYSGLDDKLSHNTIPKSCIKKKNKHQKEARSHIDTPTNSTSENFLFFSESNHQITPIFSVCKDAPAEAKAGYFPAEAKWVVDQEHLLLT